MTTRSWHKSPIGDFQAALIGPTLRNAASSQFYAALYSGIELDAVTLQSWEQLPCTSKEVLRRAGDQARHRRDLVCDEVFTSGTTGKPFVIVRGDREQAFAREFYSAALAERRSKPRVLKILSPYEQDLPPMSDRLHIHRIGMYQRGAFDYACQLLECEQVDRSVDPYVSVVMGTQRALLAFAQYVRTKFPAGLNSKVTMVCPYGNILTVRSRRLLSETFRCPVIDHYGLAEVLGIAAQDPITGWYHFDPPVLAEVLEPAGNQVIEDGIGRLVVTPLYPFQESQPLIRYDTGDLVLTSETDRGSNGTLAFQPLGRARFSIPTSDGSQYLLVPSVLYDVIDRLDIAARTPLFLGSSEVLDAEATGHPRYRASYEDRCGVRYVTIAVQLSRQAQTNPARALAEIHEAILTTADTFRAHVDGGHAALEVVAGQHFEPDFVSHAE